MGVNLNDVDSKKPGGSLPPGTYTAKVTEAFAVFANSGNEGIGVNFEVVGGEEQGGRIGSTLWLSERALPYSKYAIEAMGAAIPQTTFDVDDEDEDFARMCRSMVGGRVKIVVRMEKDRDDPNKEWARVQSIEKADGAPAGSGGGQAGGGASRRDDDIPF